MANTKVTTRVIADDAITSDKLASGLTLGGDTTLSGHLDLADSKNIRLGASDDLQLYHDASNSYIQHGNTGNFNITTANGSEFAFVAQNNGSVFLYHDGTSKLQTQSTGVSISGTATATTFSGALSGTIASATTATTQSASDNSTKVATTAYVDGAISDLVDSSPSALNTLNELAAALGDDANFSTTVTNSIATKLPLAGGNLTGNLGIGVSSPQFPLDLSTSSTDVAKFTSSGSYTYTKFSNSSRNWAISAGNSFSIYDETASATQLAVDGSGNLTVAGTISSGAITSSASLKATDVRVNEGNSLAGGLFKEKAVTGTGSSNDLSIFAESISNGGNIHFMTGGSATIRATIDSSGNATFGGTIDSGQIIPTSGVAFGDNAHWKVRGNSNNTELAFEYATSSTISDNNIRAKFYSDNFGIGSSMTSNNPESRIHIKDGDAGSSYGVDGADKLIIEDNDSVAIDLRSPSANQGIVMFSDGTRGVGQIGYSHTEDQMNFSTGGAQRVHIDSNGKIKATYGFSSGAPLPHYYAKRSPQIIAGSSQKRKGRVGRIYWCPNHWTANGINLQARVSSNYYAAGNRVYHLSAQYTDQKVYAQLIEKHSRHTNNTRFYLGAVTDAGFDYSGQNVYYQDMWIEANTYMRPFVDFISYGYGSGQAIQNSDITSGWGGVVVYDSIQDQSDFSSDFTDEIINKEGEYFIATSDKVNDTLNQGEYFGFNQIQAGSSLNYSTSTYKYTCPIDGIYEFGANVYRNSSTGGNISFRKTDSAGNNADDFGRQPASVTSGDFVFVLNQMKKCNQGDLVGVYNYGASFSNFYGGSDDNFSSFYGKLIREL